MRPHTLLLAAAVIASAAAAQTPTPATAPMPWPQHDEDRPQPPIVTPGPAPASPVRPPSDAIVLFDGRNLDQWVSEDSSAAKWTVRDGYFEVKKGTGMIHTKRGFGDAQYHVEWMAPVPAEGTGQDRGNSGFFLMGQYEIQVLDSYGNKTYPDGQAGAVYGQYPPLVNASRPPGQWQTYDIAFRAPRFDASGALVSPAYVTVFHNGVLVQDHVQLTGPTGHHVRPPYQAHPDRLPLALQDHGHPVRYRNIWVREIHDPPLP